MLQLNNVSYSYRKGEKALDSINVTVPTGLHLLLGENGAGKTTLLHIIAGLRFPEAGECLVDGVDTSLRSPATLSKVCIMADDTMFPASSINEMARRCSDFYPRFSPDVLRQCLDAFGMTGYEKLAHMSLGNRKKAQLAYVLALQTDILLLDEPANGLDISSRQILLELLERFILPEQTVIISTHVVWDFMNLIEGVMVINRGKMLTAMSTWDITRRLAFVTDRLPVENALYSTQLQGLFHAILPADPENPTDLDFLLLYSALHSPSSESILSILNAE